ncbi:uncharacterized protein TrAtP1_010392 [Trichoderma atroviride]|uniref:uncharacterized protein n=1 Tax=Hypocrea atroviridis TaxID=63577 RepID=UPI0033327F74|nr:hypothetical protein TrAtP1_010392 [Trichoderma atroviride]
MRVLTTTLRAGRLAQSFSPLFRQTPAVVRINSRANSTAVDSPVNFGAAPPPSPAAAEIGPGWQEAGGRGCGSNAAAQQLDQGGDFGHLLPASAGPGLSGCK